MTANESGTVADSPRRLSPAQLHALFNILTHHETYQEIQSFKSPDTIYSYSFPFVQAAAEDGDAACGYSYAAQSDAPILHMMLNKLILSLPPVKALPAEFWHVRVQGIMALLGEAELSESYDHGAMGTRKIMATASSALIESVSRGMLGGYPGGGGGSDATDQYDVKGRTYDTSKAADFARAWDDVLRAMVYGTLVDDLFTFCAEHEDIEEHSAAVRIAADHIIIQLAEFLHYVFVLSPNGRYLTKLADITHKLVPYSLIRQTLRVGNAATMINAMMRLLLAKITVGGITNWIGLTSSADDGMNLLQRIMSMALTYDASDFKKASDKIEKTKSGPSTAHLEALRQHLERPRQYHEAIRMQSIEQEQSLVVAALDSVDPALVDSLEEGQHTQCAHYYAALLSIRDRQEITSVFCEQNPDLFTNALRDVVAAFDPIIRRIHNQIDLKEHLSDFEGFLDELLAVSKGQKKPSSLFRTTEEEVVLPTVKDYAELLRRKRHLLYKWVHRIAKDTPDIRDTFRDWAVEGIKLFRNPNVTAHENQETKETKEPQETQESHGIDQQTGRYGRPWPEGGSGAMNEDLQRIFATLPIKSQDAVLPLINAHAAYISSIETVLVERRQNLLDRINSVSDSNTPAPVADAGNGMTQTPSQFLARWQELMDNTVIGPALPTGPLRRGRDVAHLTALGKAAALGVNTGKPSSSWAGRLSAKSSQQSLLIRPVRDSSQDSNVLKPPDVKPVFEILGPQFKQLLQERQ